MKFQFIIIDNIKFTRSTGEETKPSFRARENCRREK